MYHSLSLHILFFCHHLLSILGNKFLLWNQFFQCVTFNAFQLQLVEVFREKFLELFVYDDKVPILILAGERSFY